MTKYQEWADREPSTPQTLITLGLAGCLLLAGLPFLIAVTAGWLDLRLGLPALPGGIATSAIGVLLIVAGGGFALWAVFAQARIGHGTPVPMIPTRRLVVVPPFTFCRNPMVLGTIVAYFGFGVWLGSISALLLVLVFAALLLVYVKVLEETELEARFGEEYLKYKSTTPFLLPRLPKRPEGP